jgi:hypothetical protein
MHMTATILSIQSSRISGQDAVDFVVVDVFIRALLRVVVDVGVLFVINTNSLLLISSDSSSASAATEML